MIGMPESGLILAEAALSYVGLGAQPPTPSWGRMLAEAQTMTAFAPWLDLVGLAVFAASGALIGVILLAVGV